MTQHQPMAGHLAHVARVPGAVWVPHTLGAAARDGVGLGHQAGLAPADGVTWGYIVHLALNLNILVRMDEMWPWRKPLTLYLQYLTEWKLVLGKYFANMSILAILPDVDSADIQMA